MSFTNWGNTLTVINLVILISVTIGGYLAFRTGFTRTSQEVQERVIGAQKEENEVLQRRLSRLEAEHNRLNSLMLLVVVTFKKRGIIIEFDNDMVTIRDTATNTIQVSQLPHGDELPTP